MPLSRQTAERLMAVVNECCGRLSELIPQLQSELTEEEFKRMKREIGRVMSVLDSSLSAKVAHTFPDLAPVAVPIAHPL